MSTIVRKLFARWRCQNATLQYKGRNFSNVQTFGIVVVFVTIPLLFRTSVVKDGDKKQAPSDVAILFYITFVNYNIMSDQNRVNENSRNKQCRKS